MNDDTKKADSVADVKFPIYKKEICKRVVDGTPYKTGDVIYTKRISVNQMFSIQVNEDGSVFYCQFFQNNGMVSDCLSDDYNLGRGKYKCTKEEFDKVMIKVKAFMGMFNPL